MPDPAAAISAKERIFLSCRQKTCCHTTKVIVSGQDLWRISWALELSPLDFVCYCPAAPDAVDGFRLSPEGPCYQVVLAKRTPAPAPTRPPTAPQYPPCIFLWRTNEGHSGCGLGSQRPQACRTFPALLSAGMVAVDAEVCTCRRWSVLDLDRDEQAGLEQQLAEALAYSRVVAAWNAELAVDRSFPDFCNFVLDAYRRPTEDPV